MDKKVQELLILAKKDVFGGNLGDNITTFKGDGLSFREIKEYELGDDVRKINWKATAKTQSTKVNIFDIEKELNILLVFCISGSVYFGTVRMKQDAIGEIMALLSYSVIKNNNKLSTLFFSDTVEEFLPPSKLNSIVYRTTQKTLEIDLLEKQVDYKALCEHINRTTKERSLVFLVGDFYGENIDLSSISYKNEVYALVVRDRFEEYPYISGEYDFVSPVDFKTNSVDIDKNIALRYQKLVLQQDRKFYEHCVRHRITTGKIYTDEDIYLRLSQILKG